MRAYMFALGILATWRITHLLHAEDGPGDIVVKLRRLAGEGYWGALLDCFYCLSLALALPIGLCIGEGALERILLWPALSAGAIFLERIAPERTPPHGGSKDEEENPDVLRQQAKPDAPERRV